MLLTRRHGVAVVELTGVIGNAVRVPTYSRIFDAVRQSRRFRALVLDVDSPGGGAAASEALYHDLRRISEVKPVVSYVRGTGASGAYLMSCAAQSIVALPSSLVGSIGVIYLRPVMEQLLQRLGVVFTVHKGGHLKDMGGFWRGDTPEEDEKFRSLIDEVHQNFIDVVAKGRKMDTDQVRALATGEAFTGRKAHEVGLVDELGDFNHALQLAAKLGDTRPRATHIRPRRPFLSRLTGAQAASPTHILAADIQRLLSGGLYYLPASHVLGGWESGD